MKKVILTVASVVLLGSVAVSAQNMGQGSGNYAEANKMGMQSAGMHKGNMMHRGQMQKGKMNRAMRKHKNSNSILSLFNQHKKELKLTKEQRVKIKDIMRAKRAKMQELKQKVNTKRAKINIANFLTIDNFNEQAFKDELAKAQAARMSANSEVRGQRVEVLTNTFKKIFEILTPEQREKLIELSE